MPSKRPRARSAALSFSTKGRRSTGGFGGSAGGTNAGLSHYPQPSRYTLVETAAPSSREFQATLTSNEQVSARKLILAFGLHDAMPSIPGLAERWGHTVLHCPYCHGYEFGGKALGVLYVSPISVHQAMLIPEWGPTTLFLNGVLDLDEATLDQLRKREVTIETTPVAGLEGSGHDLTGVRLSDGRFIGVAALYFPSKTTFQSSLAEQLGCTLDDGPFGKIIHTDEGKLTTVPGVYAAGDIRACHTTRLGLPLTELPLAYLHTALWSSVRTERHLTISASLDHLLPREAVEMTGPCKAWNGKSVLLFA